MRENFKSFGRLFEELLYDLNAYFIIFTARFTSGFIDTFFYTLSEIAGRIFSKLFYADGKLCSTWRVNISNLNNKTVLFTSFFFSSKYKSRIRRIFARISNDRKRKFWLTIFDLYSVWGMTCNEIGTMWRKTCNFLPWRSFRVNLTTAFFVF